MSARKLSVMQNDQAYRTFVKFLIDDTMEPNKILWCPWTWEHCVLYNLTVEPSVNKKGQKISTISKTQTVDANIVLTPKRDTWGIRAF